MHFLLKKRQNFSFICDIRKMLKNGTASLMLLNLIVQKSKIFQERTKKQLMKKKH